MQADIGSDKGLGYRATFVFMAEQNSRIAHDARAIEPHAPPAADATLYVGPADFFTGNFEFLDIKDGTGPAEWRRWGRLRERAGLDPLVELIAMADALPPAAFKLFGKDFVPVSSLTWQLNLLAAAPATTDGWWLLGATTDVAANGCSSQTMQVVERERHVAGGGHAERRDLRLMRRQVATIDPLPDIPRRQPRSISTGSAGSSAPVVRRDPCVTS